MFIVELLLHLFAGGVKALDDLSRPRLARAVLDAADADADPAEFFARHEGTRVGPRRHPVIALVVAVPIGVAPGVFVGLAAGSRPGADMDTYLVGGAIVGWLCGCPVAWHVTRGGELLVLPSGVMFSYRGRDVICPWEAFDPSREVEHTDDIWSGLPIHPELADRITLVARGRVRAVGMAVQATHAAVGRPGLVGRLLKGDAPPTGRLHVRDCYAVRREELFGWLMRVADRIERGHPEQRNDRSN